MLKVIYVKVQEQVSCKKKILEFTLFNWSKDKLDQSKYGSVKF